MLEEKRGLFMFVSFWVSIGTTSKMYYLESGRAGGKSSRLNQEAHPVSAVINSIYIYSFNTVQVLEIGYVCN